MDVLLGMLDDSMKSCGYDPDIIIKATTFDLIAGGSETTAAALVWALALLLNSPHIVKQVHAELDIHIGQQRWVTESDIPNLVYLQAVVKESLRLYPPSPLGAAHESTMDCTVGGYQIPKGTRLIPNLYKIQRDPQVWPDPSEFRPERFLTSHVGVDVKGRDFWLIPFGSGRRSCPGMTFGLQVVHLGLARLLQAFDLRAPGNGSMDMTESSRLTNVKATPLEVFVSPRLPNHLYE